MASATCHRSGGPIYAADCPVRIGGLTFLPGHFTCATTGTKLNLKNVVVKDGEVFLRGKEPAAVPTASRGMSVRSQHVKNSQLHEKKQFNVMGDESFTAIAGKDVEHAKAVQLHEKKQFNVMGDESFTAIAGKDVEHAKAVQLHEKKQFNVMGDESFTAIAGKDVEHAKAVQLHEKKQFNVMGDESFTAVAGKDVEHVKAVQLHEKKQFQLGTTG